MEIQMLKIIKELKEVQGDAVSNHFSFDDLSKTMEEFDIVLRRPILTD